MPRLTKIYTRAGDDGTTGLGGGQRVQKDALRVETYGTVDELSSALGLARALGLEPGLDASLARIQNELFHLGSDLCLPEADKASRAVPRIEARHVEALEAEIDRMVAELGPLANFILPGGSVGGAQLHVARTICRRAEREVVTLSHHDAVRPEAIRYLNRLSDLLFVLARVLARDSGHGEVLWKHERRK